MFSPQRSRIHTHIHTCQVTSVMSYSLWPRDCSPPGSSVQGDTPGKNTGVGCHALLQGILPTQGLNPGLQHCRQILHCLSHKGSPKSFNGHLFKIKVKLNCRCILSSWKFSSVQFNLSVICDSPRPHGLQHTRLPCPSPNPGVYSNSCLLSQ